MTRKTLSWATLLLAVAALLPAAVPSGHLLGAEGAAAVSFTVPIVVNGQTIQGVGTMDADGSIRVTIVLVYRTAPGPNPPPPPPPPPPVKRVTDVYIVWETGDATPAQAAIRNNQGWKDEAVKLKMKWGQFDKETIAGVPKFKAVSEAAAGKLPCVVLVDEAGGTKVEPLPKTPADMLELVKKVGTKP